MGALCVGYARSGPPEFAGEVVKKVRLGDIPSQNCMRGPKFDALIEVRRDDGFIMKIVGPPSDQVWELIEVGGYYRFRGNKFAEAIPRI